MFKQVPSLEHKEDSSIQDYFSSQEPLRCCSSDLFIIWRWDYCGLLSATYPLRAIRSPANDPESASRRRFVLPLHHITVILMLQYKAKNEPLHQNHLTLSFKRCPSWSNIPQVSRKDMHYNFYVGMMDFCRQTQRWSSPRFLRQNSSRIFQSAFGLLAKIS